MNLNTQFVFDGKLKTVLYGGMAVGLLCLGLTWFNDDEYHTRFWTNYLHNAVFFTGIAFMAMLFLSAQITAFAGWMTVIRRLWEAMSQFMLVGLGLMAVIVAGVWSKFHLYHWLTPGLTDPKDPLYDKVLAGKAGFLNPVFFTVAVLGFLGIWAFWAYKLRQASIDQDTMETEALDYYKKQRKWAASFLPIGGFLSTVFLWESMMSIDPHWYSTMFAWYSTVSLWLAAISLLIMVIIYLKSRNYLEYVTVNHMHDVGKYLFGISVFWTYLWFDQFMLIWYANNGEETTYFHQRMHHYPVLFWGNLAMNFVVPFLILMRNDTKRKFGTMFFVAFIVFFGHWWDYFYMIKPGAREAAHEAREISLNKGAKKAHEAAPVPAKAAEATEAAVAAEGHPAEAKAEGAKMEGAKAEAGKKEEAKSEGAKKESATEGEEKEDESTAFQLGYTLPGLQEIGTMIGFLSLFLFFFFWQLSRVSLVPLKDPYLEESLHHDTGALIEGEEGSSDHH